MAAFSLTRVDTYPEGTSIGAYPASAWHPTVPPSGAPPVSATASATMTSGTAAFTGLADNTAYVFGASVSGTWRYIRGRTPVATATGSAVESEWTTGAAYVVDQLVIYNGVTYVTTTAHTAGATFDASKFRTASVVTDGAAHLGPNVELTKTSSYSTGFTAASFPAGVQDAFGALHEIHRRGYNHATVYGDPDPNQAAMGKLMWKKSRSIRGLQGVTPTEIVTAYSATRDLRDPGLYREAGTRRIWLTYFFKDPGSEGTAGIYAHYTDDEFTTLSDPIQIKGTNWFSGSRIRKMSDGYYYLPCYYRGGSGGTDFAKLLRFSSLTPSALANPTVMPPVRYKATTVNNGGGYNASATSIVVADGTKVVSGNEIYVPSTGEYMRVTNVSTNTLTVTRGTQSTTAAAIADAAALRAERTTTSAEFDVVELDPGKWVATVRSGGTSTFPTVSVSSDYGVTWTDWSQISGSPYATLDGWPTLFRGEADEPIMAVRSTYGLRLLQPASSTDFTDGSLWGYIWDATSANVQGALIPPFSGTRGVGKWQPIRLEDGSIVAPAYREETADQTVQHIVWAQLNPRTPYSKAALVTTEQQPTGPATTVAALPATIKIQFWSPGAFHDVTCSAQFKQATGAVSAVDKTIQVMHTGPAVQDVDKFSNGLASNLVPADETAVVLTDMAITYSSTIYSVLDSSARYPAFMRGAFFFPKGFHTLEVYVKNVSVGGSGNYTSTLPFWRNVKLSATIR